MDKIDQAVEEAMAYANEHKLEAFSLVVLLLGFMISMVNSAVGTGIVGIITAMYFDQLMALVKGAKGYVEQIGIFKSLVLGGALLTLFYAVPYFFFGIAAVIGVRMVMAAK